MSSCGGASTAQGAKLSKYGLTGRGVLTGFVLGIVAIPLAGWVALQLGLIPIAATASPMPLEQYVAKTALHKEIGRAAPKQTPVEASEANLMEGARLYRESCAVCHGLPGHAQSTIAAGMFPKPPKLLEGKGVTDDPAGRTYWVVKNGIRLSGMPSFGRAVSDEQLWDLAILLANAKQLPSAVEDEFRRSDSLSVSH